MAEASPKKKSQPILWVVLALILVAGVGAKLLIDKGYRDKDNSRVPVLR